MRLVAALCVAGPFLLALVLRSQKGVPADTLFGRWVHSSGFAVPLFALGFVGALGLPLLAGIVAGDIFASEDRYGTWKTVLGRSRGRAELFAGKALAAASYSIAVVVLLAASSLAAGLALVGSQPLVGLSGQLLSSGHAAGLVLASWAFAILPVLGFTSLGLLFSILTRSSIAGVLAPVVIAFAMQLLSALSGGEIVRVLLLGTAFDGWHGLLTAHPYYRPLLEGAAATAVYCVVCATIGWAVLRRRDFAGTGARREHGALVQIGWTAAAVAVVVLLSLAGRLGPDGITADRLDAAIGPAFGNLTVYQQELLGRSVPRHAGVDVLSDCTRPGATPENPGHGAGDDWRCTLTLLGPSQMSVVYDVQVSTNGCYRADGPPSVVGPPTIRDARGRKVLNPILHFDGCFEAT